MMKLFSKLTPMVLAAALAGLAGCAAEEPADAPEQASEKADEPEPEEPVGAPVALMETSKGTITIKLLPETAPRTVENFIELAKSGFWYKSTFHRVMRDMLIQGGDPNSKDNNPYNDGKGNSGKFLPDETSDLPFEKGSVAMAHSGDPTTASCQFFIALRRVPQWDGKYTIFGKVVEGIEVVEEISRSPLSKDQALQNYPAAKIQIKRIRIEYRDEKEG